MIARWQFPRSSARTWKKQFKQTHIIPYMSTNRDKHYFNSCKNHNILIFYND
jgi:hypothetical protein